MSKLEEIEEYLSTMSPAPWSMEAHIPDGEDVGQQGRDMIGMARLRNDAPWLIARVRELEGALRTIIVCPTCEGSGEYVFECSGCLAGSPAPHESWCGTPDVCPQCDGTKVYADNPDALAEAERALKGGA